MNNISKPNDEILNEFGGLSPNNLLEIMNQSQDQVEDDDDNDPKILKSSNYIDLDTIDSFVKNNRNCFTIFSVNIECLNSKFNELVNLIKYLKEIHNFQFSAICLQECWLDEDDVSDFEINDYQIISQKRQCSSKGGLVTYIYKDFTGTDTKLLKKSEKRIWEAQSVTIKGKQLEKQVHLINFYRPPRYNNNNSTLDDFVNEIDPYLVKHSKYKSHLIYVGDFNINLLQLDQREKYQKYLDHFTSNGLFPRITLPTRFSKKGCTLIDQIFCKFADPLQQYNAEILITKLSDHFPCILGFKINPKTTQRPKFIEKAEITEKNIGKFYTNLELKKENLLNNLTSDITANDSYNLLDKTLTDEYKLCFPSKKTKFNKYSHKIHPWIHIGILKSIKKRDKMYKKLKKTPINHPEYNNRKINLNTYNNILKSSMRQQKKTFYESEFNKHAKDMKKTWRTIGTIINKKKKKEEFPPYFIIDSLKETKNADGSITSTKIEEKIENIKEIANQFNTFFANIGESLAKQINYSGEKNISSFLQKKTNHSFHLEEISAEALNEIIKSLQAKKSCGHDKISTILLKKISPVILESLLLIINKSITQGTFPEKLKWALVTPIYKGQNLDPHRFNSYRPISLLPVLSKVFEKVIYQQLYTYMTKNNLLIISQYGFRKDHSTEFAALELVDRVGKELDTKNTVLSVFLDLSKAFDTLDHKILLQKLKHYGADELAISWFTSYLSGRKQALNINGTVSDWKNITTGVPQGSVLGPLLFLIYINDIINASKTAQAILFADDTSLIFTSKNLLTHQPKTNEDWNLLANKIAQELEKISDWLKINKLSLNAKKRNI